jgi:hypothetical protein
VLRNLRGRLAATDGAHLLPQRHGRTQRNRPSPRVRYRSGPPPSRRAAVRQVDRQLCGAAVAAMDEGDWSRGYPRRGRRPCSPSPRTCVRGVIPRVRGDLVPRMTRASSSSLGRSSGSGPCSRHASARHTMRTVFGLSMTSDAIQQPRIGHQLALRYVSISHVRLARRADGLLLRHQHASACVRGLGRPRIVASASATVVPGTCRPPGVRGRAG